jgi:hypothetical protein
MKSENRCADEADLDLTVVKVSVLIRQQTRLPESVR